MDVVIVMNLIVATLIIGVLLLPRRLHAKDLNPLAKFQIWMPMTGVTPAQIDDAVRAGNNAIFMKVHPGVSADGKSIDFTETDRQVAEAKAKGMFVVMAILGWVGLGDGQFWDMSEDGKKIPNQLDPFWPEAMHRYEWYHTEVIRHYRNDPKVVAFAPTWGIYGEAGFTGFEAGRSEHALSRFNEWRSERKLPPLEALPTRKTGPNTDFNHFVQFRFLYLERVFDAIFQRLKLQANGRPVGGWQEMYPVIGYLWTMVELPSADFALYESCFPFQTNHHPEKSLGETMGFRYRCKSWRDYRNYYLPLLARKRGEGQRFVTCQLSNDYASNYGWTEEQAARMQFDKWEDYFTPYMKQLLSEPLEAVKRDVLLVFPTFAAATLTDPPSHFVDAALIDIMLRMYGCQMKRYGSARLDKISVREMNQFKLIIVPSAAFLMRDTYDKLRKCSATVLFTGQFAKALDGELALAGKTVSLNDMVISFTERQSGALTLRAKNSVTDGLRGMAVSIRPDESFRFERAPAGMTVLIECAGEPVLSKAGRQLFLHGDLFAACCYNPNRVIPQQSGSSDASANEVDMWGPYDAQHPDNTYSYALMRGILDAAGVDYRVRNPKPRTMTPFLSDHMEQISINANIVYNNTASAQSVTVRTPYAPKGYATKSVDGRYETDVVVPAFSYVALKF